MDLFVYNELLDFVHLSYVNRQFHFVILRIMFINDSSINLNIRVEIYSQENEEKKIKKIKC